MEKTDYLLIGTGPVSVIEGVLLAKKGHNVAFIDEKEQAGGAWVAILVGHFGELEIGCHIWSYHQKAYRFLADFFDLDLIELSPQPYFLKGKLKLSYDRKNIITTLSQTGNYLRKGQLKSMWNYWRNNPAARLPVFPKKYRYPRGGARDLQAGIRKRLSESGSTVYFGKRVIGLEKKEEGWLATMDSGETLLSENVVLTSTGALQWIKHPLKTIELRHTRLNYIHYHLVIDQPLRKAFSYVRVFRHQLIHRISDISYQLEKEEETTVLLVGVYEEGLSKFNSEAAIIEHLRLFLIDQGYLAQGAKVIYAQQNTFETTYIPSRQIDEINALSGKIEVLATTDLIYGVHYRLPHWQTLTV